MEVYFFIGIVFIIVNIISAILTTKIKRQEFQYDERYKPQNMPYGFKLLGMLVFIVVFAMGFIIQYLSSNSFVSLFIPVIISYPLYYYFMFLCDSRKLQNLHKKEFFLSMFALISLFYFLFLPLAEDVSLSHQLELIISTNLPLLELVIILYVHFFVYAIILNVVLYFDFYNYVIRKKRIFSHNFRRQHSILSLAAFILSGYISSIILNGHFLQYPETFNMNNFQNIIIIYQLFLSLAAILIKINSKKERKFNENKNQNK